MRVINEIVANKGSHDQIIQIGSSLREGIIEKINVGMVKKYETATSSKIGVILDGEL